MAPVTRERIDAAVDVANYGDVAGDAYDQASGIVWPDGSLVTASQVSALRAGFLALKAERASERERRERAEKALGAIVGVGGIGVAAWAAERGIPWSLTDWSIVDGLNEFEYRGRKTAGMPRVVFVLHRNGSGHWWVDGGVTCVPFTDADRDAAWAAFDAARKRS